MKTPSSPIGAAGVLLVLLGLSSLAQRHAAEHAESEAAAVAEQEVRARRTLDPGARIDLNTADAELLERLPRIGPAMAARIVLDRDANGRFASVDELTRVRGIGPATVARLRAFVMVESDAGVP